MSDSDPIRSKRSYRSTRRQQQAAETRTAVLDAALLMFAERGWVATAMRDVARQAGVSVETVYSNFGSKGELLMAAIEVGAVGDQDPVALAERDEFRALGRGSHAKRAQAAAHLVVEIHRRNAGMILALREAAASDPDADRQLREAQLRRREDVRAAVQLIAGRPIAEPDADGVWAVTDVEVYRLLTDLSGWTPEEYESWLAKVFEKLVGRPARKAKQTERR